MTTITPTARAVLELLATGPATTSQLKDTTGRSRATIDRTLTDLSTRGLITAVPQQDGTGSDDTAQEWALTPDGHTLLTTLTASTHDPERGDGEQGDGEQGDGGPTTADDVRHGDGGEPAGTGEHDADGHPGDGDITPGGTPARDVGTPAGRVKSCRGCGAAIPPVCPTCWQKTTVYCGTCRQSMPPRQAGNPGQPEILSNGLAKLRPGELERLVLDVLATHPVPRFHHITGWTTGRIAIHLPGRSHGAINRVLDKLTSTGQLTLLGTDPKRYQPTTPATGTTAPDSSSAGLDPQPDTADDASSDPDPATADGDGSDPVPDGASNDGSNPAWHHGDPAGAWNSPDGQHGTQ